MSGLRDCARLVAPAGKHYAFCGAHFAHGRSQGVDVQSRDAAIPVLALDDDEMFVQPLPMAYQHVNLARCSRFARQLHVPLDGNFAGFVKGGDQVFEASPVADELVEMHAPECSTPERTRQAAADKGPAMRRQATPR